MASDLPNRSSNQCNELTFDSQLSRALQSVSVPSGLAGKLLDHVRQQATAAEGASAVELGSASTELGSLAKAGNNQSGALPDSNTPLAEPATVVRWRPRLRQLAISISIGAAALLLLAVFYFNQQPNTQQLADHCVAELEQLEEHGEAHSGWQIERPPADLLRSLEPVRHLRSARIAGSLQLTSDRFGPGVLWKLLANNQTFYVFEFRSSRTVADLTQHLTIIRRQSGRWSLAGCRHHDKIIVIACKGTIQIERRTA